jgi:predicted amidophosphoribosyltransferase
VNCSNCQAALPEDAVFCGQCGNPLQVMRTCARCGKRNPAGMRFCLGCGQPVSSVVSTSRAEPRTYTPKHLAEKILTSRSALEGERKQVTVLFADVKGSMDLPEPVVSMATRFA